MATTLTCGHELDKWYSICSGHFRYEESCELCNTGRCIECYPEAAAIGERMKFFNRKDGSSANPFPKLGVRVK